MRFSQGRNIISYELQADATISQGNPVSATYYPVLNTTRARIISVFGSITWAVTQPTYLYIRATIDGITIYHIQPNPVSTTNYGIVLSGDQQETVQGMEAAAAASSEKHRPFIYEGKSISIATTVLWATTQPTPLTCRVKYAVLKP